MRWRSRSAASALRSAPDRVAAALAGASAVLGAAALAAGLRWRAARGPQRVPEPVARRLTLSLAALGGLVVLVRSVVSG